MKKLLLVVLIALSITSCKKKDYVDLEVKLNGLEKTDTIIVVMGKGLNKTIKINSEGYFKDTLKIADPNFYGIVVGTKTQIQSFLRNGYELKITGDVNDIDKTLKYEGKGSQNSTYLVQRMKEVLAFSEKQNALYQGDSATFFKEVDGFKEKMSKLMKDVKKADTTLVRLETNGLNNYVQELKSSYQVRHDMLKKFAKGNPSPKFVNYENAKGGKKSLDDFKGKFVYMDIWATWCKPCVGEIPALQALVKEYQGKNIEFVSISTDQPSDHQKWLDMVKEKQMDWTQLYSGEDFAFMQEYQISSIPRFIFLDDKGNIVNSDAPRPSDTETVKKMFADAGVK